MPSYDDLMNYGRNMGGNPRGGASNDIIKVLQQSVAPWITAGQGALPKLQGQYDQLIDDPNSLYNKFAGGYRESPGYKHRLYEGTQAAQNAAAAGGMGGSPLHQEWASQISQNIADQDFMDYMKSIFGLYGRGLEGEEKLNDKGFEGSKGLGENIASYLAHQQMIQFMKDQAKKKGNQDWWNSLISAGGTLGGAAIGAYGGGPAGAAAGGKAGGAFGSAFEDQLRKWFS